MTQDGAMPMILTIPFSIQPPAGSYKIIANISEVMDTKARKLVATYHRLLQEAEECHKVFESTASTTAYNRYMDIVNLEMRQCCEQIMNIVSLATNCRCPFFLSSPPAIAVLLTEAHLKVVDNDPAAW